jgi:hypothetical protein
MLQLRDWSLRMLLKLAAWKVRVENKTGQVGYQTLCSPSRQAVMISSRILWRCFCLALLATKRLSAEVPVKLVFSPRGVPKTETTEAQQHVRTRLDNLIPASTSGLLSGVPWTFCSFCQSERSCEGHNPPTSSTTTTQGVGACEENCSTC